MEFGGTSHIRNENNSYSHQSDQTPVNSWKHPRQLYLYMCICVSMCVNSVLVLQQVMEQCVACVSSRGQRSSWGHLRGNMHPSIPFLSPFYTIPIFALFFLLVKLNFELYYVACQNGSTLWCTLACRNGTLSYIIIRSHSGTLMYSIIQNHSGTLLYTRM